MATATRDKISYQISEAEKLDWVMFFRDMTDMIPNSKPTMPISEHAEKYRIMPRGERFEGYLDLDRNPYIREIMDCLAPDSDIQSVRVMKGAQLGLTMMIECIICYYLGYAPVDQLLVTATAALYKKWVGRRLEPAINSYNYRDKIFAQEKRKSGKQTGDKLATKEYIGGQLDLVSAQSAPDLRSLSKRILIRDEIDGAKEELDTGEGSFLEVSAARTLAWGDLAKILDVSTPTVDGESAIQELHDEGDQRKFFVPCPYCGEYQVMVWEGFRAEIRNGAIKEVWYECEFCAKQIFEHHKVLFLRNGEWRPTAEAKVPRTRSYHIPGWYAPLGFNPWRGIYGKYMKARGNPVDMRSFVNLQKGEPYKPRGSRPNRDKIMAQQGNYKSGTVPDGVLFLTMAVDVQRGSETDSNSPPRLEFEVCGHGAGYRTWSIDYVRIEGAISDPYAGAWEELFQYYIDGSGEPHFYYKRDDGHIFPIRIVFIDSTDGVISNVVYTFCSRWNNTYPIIGSGHLKRRKGEKKDEESINATAHDVKYYRIIKNRSDQWVYSINTNQYKRNLYGNLNFVTRRETEPQKPGFCDFPSNYTSRYFEMLTAEEQRKDGTFHAGARRNEALDCRVYNLCAAHVYLVRVMDELRRKYSHKYTREQLEFHIDINYALAFLSKQAGVKYERSGNQKSDGKSA